MIVDGHSASLEEKVFLTLEEEILSGELKKGEALTEISYTLKGGEEYIRIECIDQNGCTAWTNPYFFD